MFEHQGQVYQAIRGLLGKSLSEKWDTKQHKFQLVFLAASEGEVRIYCAMEAEKKTQTSSFSYFLSSSVLLVVSP